jgi:hypothetical protein
METTGLLVFFFVVVSVVSILPDLPRLMENVTAASCLLLDGILDVDQ